MNPSQSAVEAAALVVFSLLIAVVLVLEVLFHSRLRSRHEEVWRELGRPPLLLQLPGYKEYRAYVRRRDYKILGDSVLNGLALALTIAGWLYFVSFIALVAVRAHLFP